jgi:hypothetical protein
LKNVESMLNTDAPTCDFCDDTLLGTRLFQPCQCQRFYHADCFHYMLRYQLEGIDGLRCEVCNTYYKRRFINNRYRVICQSYQTLSQKFFWLYGGLQALAGIATIAWWGHKHLIDCVSLVSVGYNSILWCYILGVSAWLERPTTYKMLVWWAPSMLLLTVILIYPKVWLDWVSMGMAGALLHRTRREIFILSTEFHYQRVLSLREEGCLEMEEFASDTATDNPVITGGMTEVTAGAVAPGGSLKLIDTGETQSVDLLIVDTPTGVTRDIFGKNEHVTMNGGRDNHDTVGNQGIINEGADTTESDEIQ